MKILLRLLRLLLAAGFTLLVAGIVVAVAAYFYIEPQLPPIERLKDVQLQVPLRVFTQEGELVAEFGEQRRIPIRYEDLPPMVINAFLATEDDRFFEHPGVDYQGLIRAGAELVRTGEKRQGGSTITMQVARNFFLSRQKTYLRKLTEIFLALKIEQYLTKQEILELYLNKIYFGQRAYGVGAAAQVYYGLTIDELNIAQIAMIAGLPKAPSTNNPVSNPVRALERRNYVLSRLYVQGFIDAQVYRDELDRPDDARLHRPTIQVEAPYVAEMVRAHMLSEYGEDAYTAGFRVVTTLDGERQEAANRALRKTLLDYDRRHGYRGSSRHFELDPQASEEDLQRLLKKFRAVGGLPAALVVAVQEKTARAYIRDHGYADLDWEAIAWARAYKSANRLGPELKTVAEVLRPGDLIRVEMLEDGRWRLAQIPDVAGALVSVRPQDGALQALVGGFDFYASKFNRATQAQRQPGSSFKPFIYSAALAKGYTVASVFNDAPVVFDDASLETTWRPENYSGKFYGPTRMRVALTNSRNLVSIRLLQAIKPRYAARFTQRFGFTAKQVPKNLSLALGSGTVTPWQMARGYSVFANGGFYVEPYFIEQIQDASGRVLYTANPPVACPDCEQDRTDTGAVEDAGAQVSIEAPQDLDNGMQQEQAPVFAKSVVEIDNVYLLTSMLRDVIKRGTGRKAMELGRNDLAGKTGTTNDQRDAWFCGFNAGLVTTVWVGFDKVAPLGSRETGGKAALPMWVSYMGEVLEGVPEQQLPQPGDLVTVRIDPKTGLLLPAGQSGGVFELFRPDHLPQRYSEREPTRGLVKQADDMEEPLF
jgi:penicillin-binding protein 1A